MDEAKEDRLFSKLDKIQEKSEETHTVVMNNAARLNNHLENHPHPVLIKEHLEEAKATKKDVKSNAIGLIFTVLATVLALGFAAWIASQK